MAASRITAGVWRYWGVGVLICLVVTRRGRATIRPLLRPVILAVLLGASLAGCTVGPNYVRAPAPVPGQYKELKGWKVAAPSDTVDRGAWWSVYKDKRLDELLPQVEISNQNVMAAAAAYEQARAIIREAQASLFPTLTGGYSATRSYAGPQAARPTVVSTGTSTYTTIINPQAAGSWAPDVWGKVRRQIESNVAAAQVSAADLDNAKLSAQGMLAVAYFNLSTTDSLRSLLDKTIAEYKRTWKSCKTRSPLVWCRAPMRMRSRPSSDHASLGHQHRLAAGAVRTRHCRAHRPPAGRAHHRAALIWRRISQKSRSPYRPCCSSAVLTLPPPNARCRSKTR